MTPRGVRNNNPGNLDRGKKPWIGEDRSPEARAREHRFAVFITPEYGFRALARTLLTYRNKHFLRTVKAVINRWAPPVENDTSAYVTQVAKALGVHQEDLIDVRDPDTMLALVRAIARHENGSDYWQDDIIRGGIQLANIGDSA